MPFSVSMPVGVIVVREEIDNPWVDAIWRPIAILPGAAPVEGWRELKRADRWVQYHAATVPLELYRKETEAYKFNLEGSEPVVYVVLVLAEDHDEAFPYVVHLVTASPFEAQDYLDSDEAIVEPIRMPEPLAQWVAEFVADHHVDEQFKKRKRDDVNIEAHRFGQEPLVAVRERMEREKQSRNSNGSK